MFLIQLLRRYVWPLVAVVLVAFTAFFVGAAISGRSDAARSARVQSSGLKAIGTVSNVANHRQTITNNSNSTIQTRYRYSADVTVALNPPVRGRDHTNLHFERQSPLQVGQTVSVLLDPDDLGYAEQPGQGTSATTWKVMAGLAVGTGVLTLLLVAFLVRRRRRGRAIGSVVMGK